MFQSPLKTVVEKLKPTESKTSLSSLRFERPSDFKKFIKFIKTETEELEKIKLPTTTEIKPKTGTPGLLGLGALGLLGLLGSAFGGGENEENLRLGSAGQTSPIKSNLFVTKNLKKVKKNLGLTKSVKGVNFKKIFKKVFPKKIKQSVKKSLFVQRATRFEEASVAIDELVKKKRDIEEKRRGMKRRGLGFVLDDVYKDQIKDLNERIKKLRDVRVSDEALFNILTQDVGMSEFKLNVNVMRELIDEAKVSFDKQGNIKFGVDRDNISRISIENQILEINDVIEELRKKGKLKNLDPNVGGKSIVKQLSIMDPLLFEPKNVPSFKGFTLREFLDKRFTQIGKITKPVRKTLLKNFLKTKIPGSGLIPFVKGIKLNQAFRLGGKLLMPVDIALTAISAPFQLDIIENRGTFFNPQFGLDRTNIVTHLYDLFTHFYNAGVEGLGFSDANKRLFISKPIDRYVTGTTIGGSYRRNLRREVDARNKKILDARRMRDLFNRSLGDQMNGQQTELLKSVPFASSTSDGAEFSIPPDPLNSGSFDYNLPIYSKLFVQ
tara:strand:- start:498 stop:2147 length:1650 start_codon:yes stop_codon:yes gene_type:complete